MGKTYIDTVKYLIKANFEIGGIVEKPDIVGAVFGQTEGLLGDELDLRELQKSGRIGRIEVESQLRGGKSFGTIIIPSSLDMVETSILAASLEIVDRVGPCDAKINVTKIEDSRSTKRKQLIERAKSLLKTMLMNEIPESKELSEMVRDEVKVADAQTYGEDRLPAGPGVATSDEIIVVEGRADVLNLLKNNINNAIAIGGANVGRTAIQLCKQKEVTVFLDGDRGGDIILRELINATDIDYVARAPPGKEVEELMRKELIKCLRQRIPVEQINDYKEILQQKAESEKNLRVHQQQQNNAPHTQPPEPRPVMQSVRTSTAIQATAPKPMLAAKPILTAKPAAPKQEAPANAEKTMMLKNALKELEGSLKARILGKNGESLAEVPIREIMKTLTETQNASTVVLDGIVTQRLVDLAEEKKIEHVVGIRAGSLTRKPAGMQIILAEN